MKRLVLFLAVVIAYSTLWGYSATVDDYSPYYPHPADSVTVERSPYNPTPADSVTVERSPYNPNPANSATVDDPSPYNSNPADSAMTYDANSMVDVKFKVVDNRDAPVANLCINLEYKSGREGSYMPGDAITKSSGAVTRSAHPNATYTVYVTDRKMLDYKGKSTRNQMKFSVTVKENVKNNFKLIWTKPTPNELDIAAKNKVTLEFLDKNGKPLRDLWISMNSASDKNPEPRQIVPGLTDKNGRVYWTVPETGTFNMAAIRFSGDDWRLDKSQSYTFTVKKSNSKFTFEWNPK